MGAYLAKHFSATKNSSDSDSTFDNHDDGVVTIKMESRITVNKISKSYLDTNDNYVSSDLDKYVRGSVCVSVQLIPLQTIQDKKHRRKDKLDEAIGDKQNERLFVSRHIKRKIGLNKRKISSCHKDVSGPRNVDKAQVDLKRLKMPPSLCEEIISNKRRSSVHLHHVLPNPKSVKERKNNLELFRQFNEDHSDDMFDFIEIPHHFSQTNLLDTSSSSSSEDEEASFDHQPGTSIINQIPQFSDRSARTPDEARVESEEEEEEESSKDQVDEYVHKTIADRRQNLKSSARVYKRIDKLTNRTKDFTHVLDNAGCSAPKRRKPLSLKDFLSDLNPALEKLNKSQRDLAVDDDSEVEPYFDEDI